jgi:hypothetical protein
MKISRTWRIWILGWVFITLLGIQIIESSHHHESSALEQACAVCQFMAHHPLDVTPPAAVLIAVALVLLLTLPRWRQTFLIAKAPCASYFSRAPPYRAA